MGLKQDFITKVEELKAEGKSASRGEAANGRGITERSQSHDERITIVNQAQIQEELGVSEVVCECVCEWLDTNRRLDTERVLHHT